MTSTKLKRLMGTAAITAGLLAGSSLVVPKDANAAQQDSTTAASLIALQAPFTTQFETGLGQLARFDVTRDDSGTAAQLDNMELYAILFNGTTFAGFTRSAVDSYGVERDAQ